MATRTSMMVKFGVACLAMGVFGCGTETDSGPAPTESKGALNYLNGCPAGYPSTALQFDTFTSQCTTSGDWDHTGIISPRSFFTSDDGYFFAAECGEQNFPNHDYVVGISARTTVGRAHSVKCATNTHGVGAPSSRHYLSRANSSGTKISDGNTYNWDSGNIMAECGFHEVVTGVAQLESNEIDAISCSPASVGTGVSSATCNFVPFNFQNHCDQNCSGGSDWAYGYYKNICRTDQYIKGISKKAGAGSIGELSGMLCCNWS